MLGVSTIGRLSIGALTDRFAPARILALALLGMAAGSSMMLWPANAAARLVYIVLYGICSGGAFTVLPVAGQSFFGLRSFGKIYAVVLFAATLGTAAGNYLGARIYDWLGNYAAAVWLGIGCATLAGMLALTLAWPSRKPALPGPAAA
jgi:OFA family oxalate/formate antiporter-like MFS transporter